MSKKIVRLTESDMNRLVKKIINEDSNTTNKITLNINCASKILGGTKMTEEQSIKFCKKGDCPSFIDCMPKMNSAGDKRCYDPEFKKRCPSTKLTY